MVLLILMRARLCGSCCLFDGNHIIGKFAGDLSYVQIACTAVLVSLNNSSIFFYFLMNFISFSIK